MFWRRDGGGDRRPTIDLDPGKPRRDEEKAEREEKAEAFLRSIEQAKAAQVAEKPFELRVSLDDGETAVEHVHGSWYVGASFGQHAVSHTATFTPVSRSTARSRAETLLKEGVWHRDVLYPGRRITRIAIVDQPKTTAELRAEARLRETPRIIEIVEKAAETGQPPESEPPA
jgi:N-methylhydantoinase A/oxoprolinase/acetone carboxylase beta subunit